MSDPFKINARPTKELFITMLVRDLTLRDAIGDLVDNSVDGAKTLRPNGNYKGLRIDIEAYPDRFVIKDNCGGIEAETARNYAFRFGRPKDQPISPGSVGQFGIGMKRSLFKLGKDFEIKSVAETSSFKVTVNVDEWSEQGNGSGDSDNWDFSFSDLKEGQSNEEKVRETVIYVTNLNTDVREQFSDENFIKKLNKEIELEHLYNIHKGLKITVNDAPLKSRELSLIESDDFKTAYFEETFEDGMKVKLYAGIGDSKFEDGGWYIFCNDRLIVGPEQTELTGWTGSKGDGGPAYHGQYQRFRGYAFLTADNSSILPWNTTKNGMDRDSPRYKQIRLKMISLAAPVMTFLNYVKKEREGESTQDQRPLEQKIMASKTISITEYKTSHLSDKFDFPQPMPVAKKAEDESIIRYHAPTIKINKIKKATGLTSLKEIGEYTFNYYYDMEIGE